MFRMIFVFLIVWLIFFFGIKLFRMATAKENIKVLKLVVYSSVCALLTSGVLFILVQLF